MAAGSKFPLLQLPDREIILTLRVMGIHQIMKLSLISKRCKQLVRSLQVKAEYLTVRIEECIEIEVVIPTYYLGLLFKHSNEDERRRLRTPQWVEDNNHRLERIGFEYSDWLKHFQDIFHYSSIDTIVFDWGSSEYDLDEIKRVFETTKCLSARDTGCYAYNLMLFQKIFPIEKLYISPEMFEDLKVPLNILQQNYATLGIFGKRNDPAEMTLNELLVINSKIITIEDVRISPKGVNKFIKLWLKGSNPRMECLEISRTYGSQYDKAEIMKGIKKSNERSEEGVNRIDIYRMDGTCATISFGFRGVEMCVV